MGRPRILVVDDDRFIREGLRAYLERGGYEVRTAADAWTALRWIKRSPLDLLLIDLDLSQDAELGVDGLDIIALLRIHQPEAKAILMSAVSYPGLARLARDRGAATCLEKPFDPAVLTGLMRSLLPRRGASASTPILCPSLPSCRPSLAGWDEDGKGVAR